MQLAASSSSAANDHQKGADGCTMQQSSLAASNRVVDRAAWDAS